MILLRFLDFLIGFERATQILKEIDAARKSIYSGTYSAKNKVYLTLELPAK